MYIWPIFLPPKDLFYTQNCPGVELKQFRVLLDTQKTLSCALDAAIQTTATVQTLHPLTIAWLRGEMRTGISWEQVNVQ